jgi:hypothetical protein
MANHAVNILINAVDKATSVFGKVGGSLSGLGSKVASVGKMAAGVGAAVIAAGATAATALYGVLSEATDRFAEVGGALNDLSGRTGIGVEALAELGHAAKMTGGDVKNVEGAIKKMQNVLTDAANGGKAANHALASVGLTAQQLQGLSPDEQFTRISEAIAAIPDPARRTAAAMDLFGKSGTQLLPMMGNLRALREEARQLGIVLTEEQVAMADNLGDAKDRMSAAFDGLMLQIGAQFANVFIAIADQVTATMSQVIDAVRVVEPVITEVGRLIYTEFQAIFNAVGNVTVFDALTFAIGLVADTIRMTLVVFNSLRVGITAGCWVISKAFQHVAQQIDLITFGVFGLSDTMQVFVDDYERLLDKQTDRVSELWNGPTASEQMAQAMVNQGPKPAAGPGSVFNRATGAIGSAIPSNNPFAPAGGGQPGGSGGGGQGAGTGGGKGKSQQPQVRMITAADVINAETQASNKFFQNFATLVANGRPQQTTFDQQVAEHRKKMDEATRNRAITRNPELEQARAAKQEKVRQETAALETRRMHDTLKTMSENTRDTRDVLVAMAKKPTTVRVVP